MPPIESQACSLEEPASEPAGREPAGRDPAARRTYIRPRGGWQAIDLKELWRARDLLWMFTVRDVKVRYKQTFFGYAWALLVPAAQILVFSVFFGELLGISDRVNEAAGRPLPYPLFALTGQIVWNFFRMTVDGAGASLNANANIIRKIYVPRLILPIAALGRPAIDSAVVFLLMLAMTAWYAADPDSGMRLTPGLLLAPLILAAAAIPALGVGLSVAALTVNYRDLQYVVPVAIGILFYATPVIYSVDVIPDHLDWLIYLNPVAGFVQAHRAAVLGLPIDWAGLGTSLALSLGLVVFGLFYFARTERQFADVA